MVFLSRNFLPIWKGADRISLERGGRGFCLLRHAVIAPGLVQQDIGCGKCFAKNEVRDNQVPQVIPEMNGGRVRMKLEYCFPYCYSSEAKREA